MVGDRKEGGRTGKLCVLLFRHGVIDADSMGMEEDAGL
jgi:hypothetical protein